MWCGMKDGCHALYDFLRLVKIILISVEGKAGPVKASGEAGDRLTRTALSSRDSHSQRT